MRKWMLRFAIALLLAVFVFSAISLASIRKQYLGVDQFYADAAKTYVHSETEGSGEESAVNRKEAASETAPIQIDFESLQSVNSDVAGWIYCEGTPINYPVLKGENNDVYLHHTYEGTYSSAGSIFVDEANRPVFSDSNTIIYGHHMKNGSMFASLEKWADQAFYEEHPVMWLLTPKQDYMVVLFSGYETSAYSDTYTVFTGPCAEFDDYLKKCVQQSDFRADFVLDEEGYYILLSTCAYAYTDARYVLHGMLVPVDRRKSGVAGGIDT